ncbi:MAG: WG repeat-containing protein [Flavobacterium sp.]|nr:MAG: WG repeat-containing protein [Flavobacterium sp.]
MKKLFKVPAILLLASVLLLSCNRDDQEEISLIPVKVGENWQYVNREGKIIINPQFAVASIFRDGIALVKSSGDNGKWGYINEDGKYVINPTYARATIFNEGLAWVVSENGAPVAIDVKGATKFSMQDAQNVRIFRESLAAFSKQDSIGEKWGFVDKTGKIVIPAQFESAGNFHDGKCFVKNKDGKFGYIDTSGKIVINYQFDEARNFENNCAVVALKDKFGVIDSQGKYVINPQFNEMYPDGDMFTIEQDKKWGWCDKEGKIVINPQFDDIMPFHSEDLAAVQSGKMSGYINKEGKIVINPQFDFAYPFNNNLAIVNSGEKFGFIDSSGKYLVNPQFDGLSYDMAYYVFSGSSVFETVETEFFDIAAITNRINFSSPEGLNLSDNAGTIINKLKLSESELAKYESNQVLFMNRKISNDATVSLALFGSAFRNIESGWSYDRVFDPNYKSIGLIYSISLSGKAAGKAKDVKDAFEKKLSGYTKVKQGYSDGKPASVYKDNSKFVILVADNSDVSLFLVKGTTDLSHYLSGINSYNPEQEVVSPEIETVAPEAEVAPAYADSTSTSY